MLAELLKLVILRIHHRLYAIDSTHFQEVIRGAEVTQIPFVPGYIEGLVNVEGRIATQIDLGRLFSDSQLPSDGKELAFIHTGRSICALRVEQVVAIVEYQQSDIEKFDGSQRDDDSSDRRCISGELIYLGDSVLLLDHNEIGQLVQAKASEASEGGLSGRTRLSETETTSTHIHYLVAYAGEERFGFAIDCITELVKASYCTPIPGAPYPISGLSMVRGQPVLSASLCGLLDNHGINHQSKTHSSDAGWIVLMEHDALFVGLQVDRIVGIEEYASIDIISVNHPDSTLKGVVENSQGELTMLVDSSALLSGNNATLLRRFIPANRQQNHNDNIVTRACLAVKIREELFAIPLDIVSRVIQYKKPQTLNDDNHNITGAIDVDGRVVPIISMDMNSNHSADETENNWSEYVIVEHSLVEYAIRVSRTDDVIAIPAGNISRTKNTRNPFVSAVTQYNDSIYSVFNNEHLGQLHTT